MRSSFEHQAGTVMAGGVPPSPMRQKLAVGQVWVWEGDEGRLHLGVAAIGPEGEVVLRPLLPEKAAEFFPPEEFVKGQAGKCPFKKVDAKLAASQAGVERGYKEGDLLCHEAWSVWAEMEPAVRYSAEEMARLRREG